MCTHLFFTQLVQDTQSVQDTVSISFRFTNCCFHADTHFEAPRSIQVRNQALFGHEPEVGQRCSRYG